MTNEGLSKYGWGSNKPKESHNYIFPKIQELLPNEKKLRILDAGCGNGYMAAELAKLGHEVTGMDIAEDGISIAQRHYPDVQFYVRSIYDNLEEITQDIDVVVSTEVIEHLYDPQRFLKRAFVIIKPGGWIILTTPYHGYLKNLALSIFNKWDKHHTVDWEGGHIKFFSERTLSKMLESVGFSEITFNNAGRIKWLWKSMVSRAQKNV